MRIKSRIKKLEKKFEDHRPLPSIYFLNEGEDFREKFNEDPEDLAPGSRIFTFREVKTREEVEAHKALENSNKMIKRRRDN